MFFAHALDVVLVEVTLLLQFAPDRGTSTSADVGQNEEKIVSSQSQNTHLSDGKKYTKSNQDIKCQETFEMRAMVPNTV